MQLVPYADADRWLTEALETDPAVMAELGGAWSPADIDGIHRRRLDAIARGAWAFTIVPDDVGRIVGSVVLWKSDWQGEAISEAGWMMLPEYQGRGYASEAVRLLIERAAADGSWGDIHAFPGVTNEPSNAICRKNGFELLGEVDVDYGDRQLRCNHWVKRAG